LKKQIFGYFVQHITELNAASNEGVELFKPSKDVGSL